MNVSTYYPAMQAFADQLSAHNITALGQMQELYRELVLRRTKGAPLGNFALFDDAWGLAVPTEKIVDMRALFEQYAAIPGLLDDVRMVQAALAKLKTNRAYERWNDYQKRLLAKYDLTPVAEFMQRQLTQNVRRYFKQCIIDVSWRYTTIYFEARYQQRKLMERRYGSELIWTKPALSYYHSSGLIFEKQADHSSTCMFLADIDRAKETENYLNCRLAYQRARKLTLLRSLLA